MSSHNIVSKESEKKLEEIPGFYAIYMNTSDYAKIFFCNISEENCRKLLQHGWIRVKNKEKGKIAFYKTK